MFSKSRKSAKPNVSILVDYAHEPESMQQLLTNINQWKPDFFDYIIHVVSCDGVGRDDWKKPVLGDLSYKLSDYSIVTTDNYDKRDDPQDILDLITTNFPKGNHSKFTTKINRLDAFNQAFLQIQQVFEKEYLPNFLIVSTGVGNENGLNQPEGLIEWDEKKQWQDLFQSWQEEILKSN